MSHTEIERLLQNAIGLDVTSIGHRSIHYAIQRRIQKCASLNEDDYLKLLRGSQTEMTELIEEVVVPETWFFRQEEAFRLLKAQISEWSQRNPGRIPRLLSMPCSNGEEAYSIAMALLDAGFHPHEFSIDAIDISERALAKARRGIYGNGSFRGKQLGFRKKYFHETDQGFSLDSMVRQAVAFHSGNVLDHAQIRRHGRYDVVFCRNLLIYFNQQDRRQAFALIASLLREGGLLFVGHAEAGIVPREQFASIPHRHAFAFRRDSSQRRATDRVNKAPAVFKPAKNTVVRAPVRPLPRPGPVEKVTKPTVQRELKPPRPQTASGQAELDEIKRLADGGMILEAKRLCEAYLKQHATSSQGWFLLGLICDQQGQSERARDAFRKALYLEPDHYETLVHLALLLEQLGDKRGAANLRARVQRVQASL